MNKKLILSVISVLCAACMLTSCAVARAEAETVSAPTVNDITVTPVPPTEDPTDLEKEVSDNLLNGETVKEMSGTVVEVAENQIVVSDTKGNTIVFTMTYIQDTEAKAGDEVTISYIGDVLDCPEAVSIQITKDVNIPMITGTVIRIFADEIFVEVQSTQVFGFYSHKDSFTLEGVTELAVGDYGNVYYTGSLLDGPTAYKFEVLTPTKDRSETDSNTPDASLENKHLTGVVTSLSSSSISILTSKNRTWTFKRSSASSISGKYNLEVGASVRITYDGYASNHPLAKAIKVTAAPDPTPKTHKTSGVVQYFGGMELGLDNGFSCDCAYAKISGDGNREPGDYATVTYYTQDGRNYATYIRFDMLCQ